MDCHSLLPELAIKDSPRLLLVRRRHPYLSAKLSRQTIAAANLVGKGRRPRLPPPRCRRRRVS